MLVDHGVGIRHHGDEEVQQNYHVDHGIRSEHQESPETGVGLDSGELEAAQVHHSETCPEEGLGRLENTGEIN